MRIARYGVKEILIATATVGLCGTAATWAALAVSPWYWGPALSLLVVWLFTIAFFRDPRRRVPEEEGVLVAPADGKVTEITRLEQYEGIDGPAIRIGIFLSIFDVHINRAPCAGRIVKTEYHRGEFLDARHPESGMRNEANTFVIEPDAGTESPIGSIVIRQIAGVIARRIVCSIRPGDVVQRGQRVGMIKFGSRTELIVPAGCGLELAVAVDDRVRAGATVLMKGNAKTSGMFTSDPTGSVCRTYDRSTTS